VLVFALTIAVGLGVGYAVLKFTGGKAAPTPTPEPVVIATPEPEPIVESTTSANASESAAVETTPVEKDKVKILVINATGVAGLAGKVKTTLTDDDFSSVTTGNAKGEYTETTDLVLMPSKTPSLISALEAATGRTLIFDEDYQTEDPNSTYDAVIVLNVAD
jgi:hypothetical protein